jgi:hypothetical protein
VGVELLESLCHKADNNARRLRGRKAPIQVICSDVVTQDLSDGTIYFMFNPFGRQTLQAVLHNLHASLVQNSRSIKIAYYNSAYEDVLSSCDWLRELKHFYTRNGLKVSFWVNKPLNASTT